MRECAQAFVKRDDFQSSRFFSPSMLIRNPLKPRTGKVFWTEKKREKGGREILIVPLSFNRQILTYSERGVCYRRGHHRQSSSTSQLIFFHPQLTDE